MWRKSKTYLSESRLNNIIKECINKILFETKSKYDYLFDISSDLDITNEVMTYLSWSKMGENSPVFSVEAAKLHEALMSTLYLFRDDREDCIKFANILNYIRVLQKRVGILSIMASGNDEWDITIDVDDEMDSDKKHIDINPYDFGDDSFYYGIVYSSWQGWKQIQGDYHGGSTNGSSGYYTVSAKMDEDMKQKIYSMGLVPALKVTGSYHENFVECVGILPEFVSRIKKETEGEDTIFFECEFSDL